MTETFFRKWCSSLPTSYSAVVMTVTLFVLYIDHPTFLLPRKQLGNRCWEGEKVEQDLRCPFVLQCEPRWYSRASQRPQGISTASLEPWWRNSQCQVNKSHSQLPAWKGRYLCHFNGRVQMTSIAIIILLDLSSLVLEKNSPLSTAFVWLKCVPCF